MTRHHHDFVLLHPGRADLLAVSRGSELTLPRSSSDDGLETPEILTALHDLVPLDALMLRPAGRTPAEPEKGQEQTHLYVLEARTNGPLPEGARWLGIDALDALAYPERSVLAAILREDAEPALVPALRPAWARRGWYGEVRDWLEAALTRLGREPVGDPLQFRIWGLSAVLRQSTKGGEVYFKAAMTHFSAEPRITAAVAALFPALTPTVLALEPTKGWMLLEPFAGQEIGEAQPELCGAVLRRFSEMQLASVAYRTRLLAAGCPDRGLTCLRAAVPRLLRDSIDHPRLSPVERSGLLRLEPRLLALIDDLAACGLPETLVHGDLHFGNVVVDGERVTIFDWTDACWSHPFFDLTLQSKWHKPETWGMLSAAYLEPWESRYDKALVERALTLAQHLSPLFYAQSYEGIGRGLEPGSSGEFDGVVAHFLRQLLETRASGPL